jgi:hypothetical protein
MNVGRGASGVHGSSAAPGGARSLYVCRWFVCRTAWPFVDTSADSGGDLVGMVWLDE